MSLIIGSLLLVVTLSAAAAHTPIPLVFEANRGQGPAGAEFLARLPQGDLLLGSHATFTAAKSRVRMVLVNGSQSKPRPERKLDARIHHYQGRDRSQWIENIPAYAAIRYPRVYRGIDLVYHGNAGALEYDFEIAPGADPKQIAFRFDGAPRVRLMSSGDLEVSAADGVRFVHRRPVAYQEANGKRVNVDARYELRNGVVRCATAGYDTSKPLVIDPVLGYAGVVAGGVPRSLAVDSAGNTYLTVGTVYSYASTNDVVITKITPSGQLASRTNIGGFGPEMASNVVLDSQGNVFVAGVSESGNFPVTGTACQGWNADAFVAKLSPSGALLASRCIGGIGAETVAGVVLDASGTAYAAGTTLSADFPTTVGVLQRSRLGIASAGFVTRFNKDSLAVEFATYLGSLGTTVLTGIAIGGDGQPVLLGATTTAGFPFSPGSYDPPELAPDARSVAFLAKLNAFGTSLTYAARLFAVQDVPAISSFSLAATRVVADGTGVATVFDGPSRSPLRVWKLSANGTTAVLAKSIPGWASVESLALLPDGSYLLGGVDAGIAPIGPDSVIPRSPGPSSHSLSLIRIDPTASQVLSARVIPGSIPMAAVGGNGDEYVAVQTNSPGQTPVTPGAIQETTFSSQFGGSVGVLRLVGGGTCQATVAPGFDLAIPVSGGPGLIPIEAPPNCTWMVTIDSNWIGLNTSVTGIGTGSLPYTAMPLGPTEAGRRATLTLSNGAPVVLTQGQPPTCPAATLELTDILSGSFSVQPFRISPAGGNFAGTINPSPGCPWTISSQADWITISPVLSGSGRASIAILIARNDGPARAGAIRLNNMNLLVNQDACAYAAFPSSTAFPGFPGTLASSRAAAGMLFVNTTPSCGWSAASNAAWFRLSGDTNMRAGNGVVRFVADENPLTTARAVTVTVGPASFSFSQPGRDCQLTISSPAQTLPAAGGTVNMSTTASSNTCAMSHVATPPATSFFGTGGLVGSATMAVPANTSPIPRAFRASVGLAGGLMSIPFMQDGVNTPAPFTDVPTNHPFLNHITIIKDRGIDRGCSVDGQRYCSETAMTRSEMAGFLFSAGIAPLRTDNTVPVGEASPMFEDVPATHPYFRAIQAIRVAGITIGCSTRPARYCPDAPVTRGEMAAFIVRAVLRTDDFDYDGTPYFQDVPTTHPFFRHIQRLRNLGITVGCGNGNFCPNDTNTRGQMAAFIVRAFLSGLFN